MEKDSTQIIETATIINTVTNSENDPVVMYLIVRESLNMSIGKTSAQVGHAVQLIMERYVTYVSNVTIDGYNDESVFSSSQIDLFRKWLATDYRKVVLKADEKEWDKLKNHFQNSMVLVIDNGLTELPAKTETVIGLLPMKKIDAPKIVKKLQLLK